MDIEIKTSLIDAADNNDMCTNILDIMKLLIMSLK